MHRDERPRRRAGAVAVLVAVLVAVGALAGPAGAEVAPPGTVPTPAPAGAPAVSDNPFIPENANLSDCISSLPGPNCGSKGFTDPRNFNLMFKTHMGPIPDDDNEVFLRPETAQAMFVDFAQIQASSRKKPRAGADPRRPPS